MHSEKILIVEDETKVAQFIKKGLEENSWNADIAYDGMKGREMALSGKYDLVILDLNLPMLTASRFVATYVRNIPKCPCLC